jgi:hypothetical protein
MMVATEQLKAAKELGKFLRKGREKQGFNLAILASTLKWTVVEIVAIEDGNLYAFDHSLEKFSQSAHLYANAIGVDITKSADPLDSITTVTAKDWEVPIPAYLKKRD